ncbi:MAG: PilZ domain-containing protein [Proteobacteria bacterium]|nr:PilZ domain-containing protein [Pseudomonadota bacterium]
MVKRNRILEERRAHKRFLAKDGTYAIFGKYSNKLGQVIDISNGGLAFRYNDDDNRSIDLFNIGIMVADASDIEEEISFKAKTIADFEISQGTQYFMPLRQSHVQFVELTDEQKALLSKLIINHTRK